MNQRNSTETLPPLQNVAYPAMRELIIKSVNTRSGFILKFFKEEDEGEEEEEEDNKRVSEEDDR